MNINSLCIDVNKISLEELNTSVMSLEDRAKRGKFQDDTSVVIENLRNKINNLGAEVQKVQNTLSDKQIDDFFSIKSDLDEKLNTIETLYNRKILELTQRNSPSSMASVANAPSSAQEKAVAPIDRQVAIDVQNAKIPRLDEEQQFELLLEQAVHEIIPGLFLGGSDYQPQPNAIHHYNRRTGAVEFEQIISATHWQPPGGFKPSQQASVFKFPGDPNRNPIDVTLTSFKSEGQRHLKEALSVIDNALAKGKKVFVHCQQGKDRSATVVIAYIMSKYNVSVDTALTFVRSKRWLAEPGDEYISFLKTEFQPVKFS
jgi:hypothetical protein